MQWLQRHEGARQMLLALGEPAEGQHSTDERHSAHHRAQRHLREPHAQKRHARRREQRRGEIKADEFGFAVAAHNEDAGHRQRHGRRQRHEKHAAPTQVAHHEARHNGRRGGADGDHGRADGQIRPQAPMGHAVDDDVHHERNEHARTDRLHEPRHQKQQEVRRQKAARGARDAQSRRREEQRPHRQAPVQVGHAGDHHGDGDHVTGHEPLRRHGIDGEIAHDGDERHIHQVLVEASQKPAAVEHRQKRAQ